MAWSTRIRGESCSNSPVLSNNGARSLPRIPKGRHQSTRYPESTVEWARRVRQRSSRLHARAARRHQRRGSSIRRYSETRRAGNRPMTRRSGYGMVTETTKGLAEETANPPLFNGRRGRSVPARTSLRDVDRAASLRGELFNAGLHSLESE